MLFAQCKTEAAEKVASAGKCAPAKFLPPHLAADLAQRRFVRLRRAPRLRGGGPAPPVPQPMETPRARDADVSSDGELSPGEWSLRGSRRAEETRFFPFA